MNAVVRRCASKKTNFSFFFFLFQCFDSVLSVIATHDDWNPIESIPVQEVVAALNEHYVSWVVEHVLRTFSSEGCSGTSDHVALSVNAARFFRAEQVLVECNVGTSSELAREWKTRLPRGVGTGAVQQEEGGEPNVEETFVNLVRQEGLGLIEQDGIGLRKIRTFLRRDLSIVTKTRFQQLFEARSEWTKDDLLYYLIGLEGGEGLLMKWARATQGGTVFSKR